MEPMDYNMLRENSFLSNLSDEDFNKLLKISHKIYIEKEAYFIREGDVAENFYFILSGKVAIVKADKHHHHEHLINVLKAGDTVGEMALLDHKVRSASAKAKTHVELLSISFGDFVALAKKSPGIHKLMLSITENVSGRMRQTNTVVAEALEKKLNEFQMRAGIGLFMMNVIVALCFFTFFLSWISQQEADAISSTIISLPLTVIFVLLFFSIMKSSGMPLRTFGLTTHNWRKALVESIFFTVIVCMFIVVLKWVAIQTIPKYIGHPIFEPYLTINLHRSPDNTWTYPIVWWITLVAYCLVVAPLQELIVRGGMQGPLEVFLTGKYPKIKAIIISNLMFSTAHLFLGIDISFMVFVAGLYFGWLYSRHPTLIGVIVAHAMLGTWSIMIVGL